MRKLYEINADILEALEAGTEEMVDEETGEIISIKDRLEALEMEKDEKIEHVALYAKDTMALIEQIAAERKALKEREDRLKNKLDGLKQYLAFATDGKPVKDNPRFILSFRPSESVTVNVDASTLPVEYQNVKTSIEPKKMEIKKALKAGKEVKGCELVKNLSVSIK